MTIEELIDKLSKDANVAIIGCEDLRAFYLNLNFYYVHDMKDLEIAFYKMIGFFLALWTIGYITDSEEHSLRYEACKLYSINTELFMLSENAPDGFESGDLNEEE